MRRRSRRRLDASTMGNPIAFRIPDARDLERTGAFSRIRLGFPHVRHPVRTEACLGKRPCVVSWIGKAFGEGEWRTRKTRIDPKLGAAGWPVRRPPASSCRTEEEETDNGPSDYALWLDNAIVGVVEAKKVTVGPQGVLTQSQRYSRGLRNATPRFGEFGLPVPLLDERRGDLVPSRPDLRRLRRVTLDSY